MLAYFRQRRSVKEWLYFSVHVLHFLVVLGFLWAGIVEFISNPPFFDAYGDAATRNSLPEGLFEVNNLDRIDFICVLVALIQQVGIMLNIVYQRLNLITYPLKLYCFLF